MMKPCAMGQIILTFLALMTMCGCSFLRLSKELAFLDQVSVVSGTVEGVSGDHPIVIMTVYSDSQTNYLYDYTVTQAPAHFYFAMEPGTYQIAAFEDVNHDYMTMVMVAHSMGGLLARATLLENVKTHRDVSVCKLITISTPWHGHSMAEFGVHHAPSVIPSWRDMVPNSNFLADLFETTLPTVTDHYLLFGYRGGGNPFSGSTDGTVSLRSQLRRHVQQNATLVRGYDEDHTSILASEQMLSDLAHILPTTLPSSR